MDPALALLDGLEGEWRGSGTVVVPGIEPAPFDEVIRFSRRNPTSLDYWQRAVAPGTDDLMHSEAGIWRLGSEGRLELTIALPGSVEIAEGMVVDGRFDTVSTATARAATSHNFRAAKRRYVLAGDRLEYDAQLESVHFPMTDHLSATLHRSSAGAPLGLVIPFAELDRTKHAEELVGADHGDVPFSLILVHGPPGTGPRVHRHPYAEVFIVERGEATFVLGDARPVVTDGHVVIGPPNVPHGFTNTGSGELRLIAIHGARRFITEWLAGGDPTWVSKPRS